MPEHTPDLPSLRGASFNILRSGTGEKRADFLGGYVVRHELDFVLLQEINGAIQALRAIPGYKLLVFRKDPDKGDNGILIREGLRHGPGFSVPIRSWWLGSRGGKLWTRSLVSARLDGWLRVVSVHAPVGPLNHSRRFTGPLRRIRGYKRTAAAIVALADRYDGPLLVAGDWNATVRTEKQKGSPTWAAEKAGLTITPGGRIDWTMSRDVTLTDRAVDRDNGGSDHPIIRFTVTKKAAAAKPTKPPRRPRSLTPSADKIIAAAKKQNGYREGRSGGHWNNANKFAAIAGHANGYAWCVTFVYAIACTVGLEKLFPNTASCDVAANWYRARGQWSEYPAIGAEFFLGTPNDLIHTGFVTAYTATTITTSEGNTNTNGSREGDGVYLKTRLRRDVVGYGYPAYPEGIVSADPAWAKHAPKGK